MELSHADLLGFKTRYETLFNQAFKLAESTLDMIALTVESGRVEQVVHRWMRGIPSMREFKGSRVINNVDSDGFTIKNKKWEDTIGIPREDLERDQFKVYDPMTRKLGEVAKLHRDVLAYGLLSTLIANNGNNAYAAYDGVSFYGVHNVKRKVPFTNFTTAKLTEISLANAIAELKSRKDSHGNPLVSPTAKLDLLIPPQLETTANKLANSEFIVQTAPGTGASSATNQAASGSNQLKGLFTPRVNQLLNTSTEWHLTLSDKIYKPIVFQLEQDIEFSTWEKFLAQWVMEDQFILGIRALYNVAPGLPEMVFGSTGTV
jgi:phage major head subunit gpT-like protein